MTAKTEARDPAPGDLAALERVLERVRYLLPVQVDTKFQEFSGPECEDGFGRYAIDFDEREDGAGSEAEDLAALLNSVPDLIALARSAEAAEGHGWQPIETAPKDRAVLLADANGNVTAGNWDEQFENEGWDDAADRSIYRGAWTDHTVASWGYEERNELQPTHWQPLPAPPAISALDKDHPHAG